MASKALQSISSNIQSAMLSMKGVREFFESYLTYGCEKVQREAAEMCTKIEIEPEFTGVHKRPANRQHVVSNEQFEREVFSYIIKVAMDSLSDRFEALKNHSELFSFLYDFEQYEKNRLNGELMKSCKNLEVALSHNDKSDIEADELFAEFSVISTILKTISITHALDILNAIMQRNMENVVPNFVIALRILLTTPVSVASGERSFSKLKIIKNYLRNSMNMERLNDLTLISIEHEVAESINYDDIIDDFSNQKARKIIFNDS